MGYLKSIGTVIIYIGFFLAVITFLPNLPPEAEYSEYSIKQPSDVKLQFELKNRLQGAEELFSGEVKGPECFASYNGEIYTGIRGGYVVKIEENRIKPIVKFGQKCDGLWQEEKCGRPLGLKFNDKGELFVADAYYGIFKVNVNTRHYVNIVNSSEPIDGKIPKVVNSLDIAKNGDIYWTDSSTDFRLHDGAYTFLANPTGRLFRYNAATRQNEVLMQNLAFANGVLLSDDESFVIVAESLTSRVIKYNLKGPKAGQHEVFADALPGLPDNVHSDGQGGFLVSLIIYIDSQHPFLPQSLMPHPYLRKMLSRLSYLIEAPFKLLQDVYPNYYAERVLYSVGSFDISRLLDTKHTSVILRIDKTGKVLDAVYSEDKKVNDISSAYLHNGYLWLGSPWKESIMRVPLKQALPDLAINKKESTKEQKKEEPLLTASRTPNVKIEAKQINAKPAGQATKQSPSKPIVKAQTTQKPKLDATTAKPTTSQPSTTTPKPSTTAAPITTTTPKPHTSKVTPNEIKKDNVQGVKTDNLKEIKKDNVQGIKKDNLKEIKKDNSKEIKRDNSAKSETSKKNNEATVKQKSDDATKKVAHDTQSKNSKPVEKKDNSNKK
ncbi:Adipocyte plasma membrane-associated protein Hemomucin [Anthophora retusa]